MCWITKAIFATLSKNGNYCYHICYSEEKKIILITILPEQIVELPNVKKRDNLGI